MPDRIEIKLLLRKLAAGATAPELLDAYPRLEREDILAAIGYAADVLAREETFLLPPREEIPSNKARPSSGGDF